MGERIFMKNNKQSIVPYIPAKIADAQMLKLAKTPHHVYLCLSPFLTEKENPNSINDFIMCYTMKLNLVNLLNNLLKY